MADDLLDGVQAAVDAVNEQLAFLYDDFFSEPGDKGVETVVEHRGHKLKFRMRKSLTLGEKQSAMSAAIKISVSKEGIPSIDKMDQGAYTQAVVLAAVTGWPFEYSPGKPVPINEKTVARLDGSLAEKLANIVLGQDQSQEMAHGPFGTK